MAMDRQGLSALFRELERQEKQYEREAKEIRKNGVGLLTPKKLEEYAKSDQNLVLAYGRMGHTVSFTPAELRQFLRARRKIARQYSEAKQGATLRSLLSSSLPVDIKRSKGVRSAVLYGRKGNVLNFMVSGVQRAHYRVQIRLEGWDRALTTNTKALKAVQQIISGRLSIECSCGRHQYWYRYLATIGGFAIAPLERDFPKIKNPKLSGCCCKHILKVLNEMQKSRVQFVLAKELDAERNAPGFGGSQPGKILSNDKLRMTTSRMSAKARELLDAWRQQVDKLRVAGKQKPTTPKGKNATGTQTPQKVTQKKATPAPTGANDKQLISAIKGVLKATRSLGMSPDTMLDAIAKAQNVTRAHIDTLIKDNNL